MVGRRGLTRDVLLEAFADCGVSNARSFLATGNVAFTSDGPASQLSRTLALAIAGVTEINEPVFIRSVSELERLHAGDPFALAPPGGFHERCVTFLQSSPRSKPALPIRSQRGDVEIFSISSRNAFSVTRLVGGRPGQPGRILERRLDLPVTTRNWNTVERILCALEQA